jgi:hypothetical protein
MGEKLYSIYRFYQDDRRPRRMAKDLTLKKAQEWCNDPETSSRTASTACHDNDKLIAKWNDKQKHWFDGFTEQ